MATKKSDPIPAPPAAPAQRPPMEFSFQKADGYTGRIQFTTNRDEDAEVSGIGRTVRGEVKKVSAAMARQAVGTGWFIHVPADTPLGQPDEFKLKKAEAKESEKTPPTPFGGTPPSEPL